MKKLSQRMQRLSGFYFAELDPILRRLRAAGREVIRLDVGSPDLPPPPEVIAAMQRLAALPDLHGYQPHRGIDLVRHAWVTQYEMRYGVYLDPERQVQPLLGSKEGIFHLSQTLLDPGDVALVPDPGYVTYSQGALFAGARVHYLPLRAENGYLPDLEAIPARVLRRAKLLWLNYPNNPTGAVASPEFFAAAFAFAEKHKILLCHDAAYNLVTFDGYQAPSLLQIPGAAETALEFNSLSKSHNMAGWRLGAALGSPAALAALLKLKSNLDSGHFRPLEETVSEALDTPQAWIEARNQVYQQRQQLVIAALRSLGIEIAAPQGSIYVWAPCPAGFSSAAFARKLLEEHGLSVAPGTIFGAGGEGYFRISLVVPLERLGKAMDRLSDGWKQAAING